VGTNQKPYHRQLFNPWAQSCKYDPTAAFIKMWVPQLAKQKPRVIHQWHRHAKKMIRPVDNLGNSMESTDSDHIDYHKPILEYIDRRDISLQQYNTAWSSYVQFDKEQMADAMVR
jgi:deoxyribodipyrimidine photolyase